MLLRFALLGWNLRDKASSSFTTYRLHHSPPESPYSQTSQITRCLAAHLGRKHPSADAALCCLAHLKDFFAEHLDDLKASLRISEQKVPQSAAGNEIHVARLLNLGGQAVGLSRERGGKTDHGS